jgi:hypothetical protein
VLTAALLCFDTKEPAANYGVLTEVG